MPTRSVHRLGGNRNRDNFQKDIFCEARPHSGTGLVQQTVQIAASLRSHDLTLFVRHRKVIMSTEFRFIEYNTRRAARGVEAARVAVIEDDDEQWIWMSKRDIAKNMMVFGRNPELIKAHEASRWSALLGGLQKWFVAPLWVKLTF